MERLRDQTTAEKGAQKAATDTQRLRKAVAAEEMRSLQVQNELARIEVGCFNPTFTMGRAMSVQELLYAPGIAVSKKLCDGLAS